jgi:hypothetical protein
VFGFKIITKVERQLWLAQIQDLKAEVIRLREEVLHERSRAEAAINALLKNSAKLALAPEPTARERDRELADREKELERLFDIFGEDADGRIRQDQELLDRIQGS